MVMARTAFGSGTINGVLALCGGEEIGGAANLMPRHLTYRSASSAGTTRDIWTDSLLNQICLLRRNPFKLDDPSTNVDSQIQPSAVNLLKAGQPYPLNASRNLTWRLRLTRWQRTRLSRAKEPLKGDSKKTTQWQRPPGRRPGMFFNSTILYF